MSETPQFLQDHPRLAGTLLALLGAGFCYWMIVLPMQQAEAHADSVSISAKGGVLGVVLLAAGLILAVGGHSVSRIIRPQPGDSKIPAYVIGAVLAVIGFVVYFWLESYLKSKGYTFDR